MILELLFGFIQAVIFFMLTLIFTSLATHLPGSHGEDHRAEGDALHLSDAEQSNHVAAGAPVAAPGQA